MNLVSFIKIKKYSINSIKKSILQSLDLLNYSFKKQIKKVVIKPNMCYYWDYTTGQTTDPNFIASIIELIRDEISTDIKISIVESDASAMKCKYAFPILGYTKMAERYNVELINLTKDISKEIDVNVGEKHLKLKLPQTIENADLKINVPKIKYMPETKITCALKNIFGCNPEPLKHKYHSKLDETIVALNKIMKFDLCILDGIIVRGNHTRRLDLIMASQDSVAFDSAAAKIIGVNPKTSKHIVLANEEGLGNIDFISKGINPEFFAKKFPKRELKDDFLSYAYKMAIKMGLGKRLGFE